MEVLALKLTSPPDTVDRETMNAMGTPSVTGAGDCKVKTRSPSSSLMVAVTVVAPTEKVAPCGFERVRVKVSAPS